MEDPAKLAKSIDIAANVLSISAILSVKKGLFGTLKPTDNQLGWSYGFCDSYAQSIGFDSDEEFVIFISFVFEKVFGKSGLGHFRRVASAQQKFMPYIIEGGNAQYAWIKEGRSPLIPLPI